MRDLVRRRVVGDGAPRLRDGCSTGTIDRAGADHLDIALHEPGTPRRASEVTGHRIVPFARGGVDPARFRRDARPDARSSARRQSGLRTTPVPHSSGKLASFD